MAGPFDQVFLLKPSKTPCKIRVKIIRLLRQYSIRGIENIEMVLLDASVSILSLSFYCLHNETVMQRCVNMFIIFTVLDIYL